MLTAFTSRRWRTATTLLAVVLLTACTAPAEFTVPLAEPGEFEVDQQLVGVWYGISYCEFTGGEFNVCQKVGGRPVLLTTLHISANPGNKELLVRVTLLALDTSDFVPETPDSDDVAHFARFVTGRVLQLQATAHPAKVGGVTYYNVRREAGVGYDYTGANEQPHFMIVQPELEDANTLYLQLLWGCVASGEMSLKGRRVELEPLSSYNIVDAPRDRLAALLRAPNRLDKWSVRIFGPFRRLGTGFEAAAANLRTAECEPEEVGRAAQILALAEVAKALATLGLKAQSLESARLALEIDSSGVPEERRWFSADQSAGQSLYTIVEAQAIAGELEAARATVARHRKRLPVSWPADPPVFATALARAGQVPEALTQAAQLPEYARADTLGEIAIVQAQSGDRTGAMQTARLAGRVPVMIELAKVFHRRGDETSARDALAEAATFASADSHDLILVARRQLEWGHADAARDTARRAARAVAEERGGTDEMGFAVRQLELAELQAELEDFKSARASLEPILRLIQSGNFRPWTTHNVYHVVRLEQIVALQVRLGDQAWARRTLEQVVPLVRERGPRWSEYDAEREVALAYAAIGDVPISIEMAKHLDGDVLYKIADRQRKSGDLAGARQTLKFAIEREQAEDRGDRSGGRWMSPSPLDRARVHLAAGDAAGAAYWFDLAIEEARRVGPSKHQVTELLQIAKVQMETSDAGSARNTALLAFAAARDLPKRYPCSSAPLLELLLLPELKRDTKK